MSNHFYLVVETPRGNLVEGMHWFLGAWIAQHLCMGSAGYFNYLLYRKAPHQTNRNETPIQNKLF